MGKPKSINRLKLIRKPTASIKVPLSKRYLLKKEKMPLDDSQLEKLNWKELLRVRIEKVIEDFVMSFTGSWLSHFLKTVLFATLLTSIYVYFLVRTNERVQEAVERCFCNLIDFVDGSY